MPDVRYRLAYDTSSKTLSVDAYLREHCPHYHSLESRGAEVFIFYHPRVEGPLPDGVREYPETEP